MKLLFPILAVAALLSACAESQSGTSVPDRIIDDSFGGGVLRRSDLLRIPYRVGIFEEGGMYVVCAAAQGIRGVEQQRVLGSIVVTVDGDVMQRGIRWATKYSSAAQLDGQTAACRLTQTAVRPNAEFDVYLSQTRF